jgi:hypothetical protein
VGAVVGAVPPPAGAFDRVEAIGRVWIAWLDARPWAEAGSPETQVAWLRQPGAAQLLVRASARDFLTVRETRDSGWKARLDGRPLAILPGEEPFLRVQVPAGHHQISLEYDPPEVRIGSVISIGSLLGVILTLTGIRLF